MHDRLPSAQLAEVLTGRVPYDKAAPAIQSWARFYFYEAAVEVINAGDLDARRQKLGRIPSRMRPYVEAEVRRVWRLVR